MVMQTNVDPLRGPIGTQSVPLLPREIRSRESVSPVRDAAAEELLGSNVVAIDAGRQKETPVRQRRPPDPKLDTAARRARDLAWQSQFNGWDEA